MGKINTKAEQVRIMQAADRVIEPPKHVPLQDDEFAFFDNIIDEFARVEWTPHQIELAAFLARSMAALGDAQTRLRDEGPVSTSPKGTPVVNPLKSIVQMEAGIILALRRSLSLNTVRPGTTTEKGKRAKTAKEAEKASPYHGEDGDDLLARPHGTA